MFRPGLIAFAAVAALGQGFTIVIGSPVASQDFRAKRAAFVLRAEGCADPAKAQIGGTAEGIVRGARQSIALRVMPSSRPGVFAVYQNWPAEGHWVVNLKGACSDANAGAIVPIGPKGFIRESAKFLSRPATDAEVDSSLKTLAQGGSK